MIVVISLIVGVLLGVLVTLVIVRSWMVGDLRIDHSDPMDAPYTFLELSKGLHQVRNKRYVLLRVKLEDFLPHE